jgi:hypothetical protein
LVSSVLAASTGVAASTVLASIDAASLIGAASVIGAASGCAPASCAFASPVSDRAAPSLAVAVSTPASPLTTDGSEAQPAIQQETKRDAKSDTARMRAT